MKSKKFTLFTILFIILGGYLNVLASEAKDNYEISDVYIASEIDIVGSMHVQEAFIIKGSINEFTRDIIFKNGNSNKWEEGKIDFKESSFYEARGFSLKRVSAKKIEKDQIDWNLFREKYENFDEKKDAKSGSIRAYSLSEIDEGAKIKIFDNLENEYNVIYLEYYIDQIVVLHNDVAEIYYTFFKSNQNISKIHFQLTTPGTSNSDVFNFWVHGALKGKIYPIGSNESTNDTLYRGINVELENYKANDNIKIRMTFNRGLMGALASALNNSKQDALDKIIEVEKEYSNKQTTKTNKIHYLIVIISSISFLVLLVFWIKFFKKSKIKTT